MKWEYKYELKGRVNHEKEIEYLNKMGEDGWELVKISSDDLWTAFYFKREKTKA